ncbi:Uncharacterised protein [Kingella potus]|uniref:DUF4124 domain-containing protein n=1 Tax=Kingella potus TaxID=265175 RepID=A0A377R132_9NEIS|nr:DUF4124 domain-containing protein [Kingella potus]UOP01672.1 DUF4124 domain-containing protein [Kingella potus]STR00031.1 Uncharacterised protein [Kingella potus]
MKTKYAAALLLASALPASAAVYTCTDSKGRTTYTSAPVQGSSCKKDDLDRASTYSTLPAPKSSYQPAQTYGQQPSSAKQQPSVATLGADEQKPASRDQIAAARKRLSDAKKALEEGKKIRYGNERNYAKYLERIAGLEKEVKLAEENLAKLLGTGSGSGISSY